MELIIELFISFFFEVICYVIGRFLIPVLSLGHARAETVGELWKSRSMVYSRHDGLVVFSNLATMFFGLAGLIAFGVAAYFFNKL